MSAIVLRFRWAASWATAALIFQALALVLQTPMEIGRGLGEPMAAAADHCEAPAPGHHRGPSRSADPCQLCLGMLAASHGVAPAAPALPLPVSTPATAIALVAI